MKKKYDENGYQVYDQIWDNINTVNLKVWLADFFRNIHWSYNEYEDCCGAYHDDPIAYCKGNQGAFEETSFIIELILVEEDVECFIDSAIYDMEPGRLTDKQYAYRSHDICIERIKGEAYSETKDDYGPPYQ